MWLDVGNTRTFTHFTQKLGSLRKIWVILPLPPRPRPWCCVTTVACVFAPCTLTTNWGLLVNTDVTARVELHWWLRLGCSSFHPISPNPIVWAGGGGRVSRSEFGVWQSERISNARPLHAQRWTHGQETSWLFVKESQECDLIIYPLQCIFS